MRRLLILTCAAVIVAVCNADDVFSDAKSWHQGFVDTNGDGIMNIGKTEFPESLLIAEPANAAHDAMTARRDERGERDTEKTAGTTPELRKTVAALLVAAGKRVNAAHDLDPDNEKAALAISKVCGIISDFKRVASEAKHRKGDTPDPEPEPTPEPTSEPDEDSSAS